MKQLAIYDSGLGGYTIYHDLKQTYPLLNMVLYADQAHAPYGNRSYESLLDVSINAISAIVNDGFKDILVACNTISATSLTTLKMMFPDINIMGIIDLTTSQVTKGSIAVLATQATIASRSYNIALANKGDVTGIALPELVGMIEGLADDAHILKYLNSVENLHLSYDTVILACTHYPLVKDLIESVVHTTIVDSRLPIQVYLKDLVEDGEGQHRIRTSGQPAILKSQIQTLFKEEEEVESWNL